MISWVGVVFLLFGLVVALLLFRGLWVLWHKMHALVGIEVGTPALVLDYQPGMALPNARLAAQKLPLALGRSQKKSKSLTNQVYWRTRHGKIPALHYLNVSAAQVESLPWEAVQWLLSIDARLARYAAWQHDQRQALFHNALSEQQFVLQRLADQTVPDAVNQFDQLARFNPNALSQPVCDGMLPAQVLLAVLTDVSRQVDGLLEDASHQVGSQLATTYRYVKTRTQ